MQNVALLIYFNYSVIYWAPLRSWPAYNYFGAQQVRWI